MWGHRPRVVNCRGARHRISGMASDGCELELSATDVGVDSGGGKGKLRGDNGHPVDASPAGSRDQYNDGERLAGAADSATGGEFSKFRAVLRKNFVLKKW